MCKYVVASPAKLISPIAPDGPWGCGKTTHAKRLEQCFKDKYKGSVKCIYWNAATADFAADSLPMFAAALYGSILEEDKKKEYVQKALKMCSGGLLGAVGSVWGQLIEKGSGINIKNVVQACKRGASFFNRRGKIEKQFKSFLETAGNEKSRVDAAKSLVQLARGEANDLVIILDELDRCRPDFALKMLENIKHLFEESGCKFILVMNEISMQSAISHLYGLNGEEAARYLGKYIKKNFQLPEAVDKDRDASKELCTCQYFRELLDEEGINAWGGSRLLQEFITDLFLRKNLQLREVEKLVGTINFTRKVVPEKIKLGESTHLDCLLCFIAYLIEFESELTMKILAKEMNTSKLFYIMGYSDETDKIRQLPDYISYIVWCIKNVFDYYFSSKEEEQIVKNEFYEFKKNSLRSQGNHPSWFINLDCSHIRYFCEELKKWLGYAVFLK